jgi:hypothetical protein
VALRRDLQTLRLLAFGVCVLAGVSLAFWVPDLPRLLVAGSPVAWLPFSLVLLVLMGVLAPTIFIAHYRLVQPGLSAARRVGPAPLDRVSVIRLLAQAVYEGADPLGFWPGALRVFSSAQCLPWASGVRL